MEEQPNRNVLVAEDDVNDAFFLRIAFEKAQIPFPCVSVRDGWEAMEYLAEPRRAGRCCLLITDLKMPRVNGWELLRWLQGQEHLRELPAVVLSSSSREEDRQRVQALGARHFFVKPLGLEGFVEIARQLHAFWLRPHCEGAQPVAGGW